MAKTEVGLPVLTLNDGHRIPMLGYGTGTAWFKQGEESERNQACIDALKTAIKLEYRHLDGAEVYKTESELGTAIKESGVDRSTLFITTKVITNIKDVKNAIKTSLEKLQVDYVDLYLIHSPFFTEDPKELQLAWAAMEEVQASGQAKSIGVSNYMLHHIQSTLETAKVVPAINQIEFHPYLQHSELLAFQKKHGIATEAYAPLTPVTKVKGPVDDYLTDLAKKYAVNPGEILLRWCIEQDVVAITTSSKESRMSDMLRVAEFKLTPDEVREISRLGAEMHHRAFWLHKLDKDDRR